MARIGILTFKALAAKIADAFPPERRVALSSLHRWFHRNRRGSGMVLSFNQSDLTISDSLTGLGCQPVGACGIR